MTIIHRMILKQLPGPFVGWLMLLMFLLLMQFLIKFLPDLAGRDLPLSLILELILYNLAYMVVLAVPMACLLTTLMVFGSLAESRSWVVIRNCGITLWSLAWPILVTAAFLSWGMMYFNNVLLPESNFRALNMWQTIRSARPGFELQPGVFYQEIDEYSILVGQRNENLLYDILIYDYTDGKTHPTTIEADRGELIPRGTMLDMVLMDGEMHRLFRQSSMVTTERYEKIMFERFQLSLDLSDLGFQDTPESQGFRSDRSTPVSEMFQIIDSLNTRMVQQTDNLKAIAPGLISVDTLSTEEHIHHSTSPVADPMLSSPSPALALRSDFPPDSIVRGNVLQGLTLDQTRQTFQRARDFVQSTRSAASNHSRSLKRTTTMLSRYEVEVHKKYSISLACFIFVLIGIPLGLRIRRGGLGVASLAAMSIFIFYWVTLVQGEKLADRELLTPWIGMWCANILIGMAGIWLFVRVAFDLRSQPLYVIRPPTSK
ncbi:MAG: LptF/LptG family permease [Bacteroidetes bacterium]|nr:LptF/LptG family permease [Bacteroidota bacterium]